jgi:hypothetical protein
MRPIPRIPRITATFPLPPRSLTMCSPASRLPRRLSAPTKLYPGRPIHIGIEDDDGIPADFARSSSGRISDTSRGRHRQSEIRLVIWSSRIAACWSMLISRSAQARQSQLRNGARALRRWFSRAATIHRRALCRPARCRSFGPVDRPHESGNRHPAMIIPIADRSHRPEISRFISQCPGAYYSVCRSGIGPAVWIRSDFPPCRHR